MARRRSPPVSYANEHRSLGSVTKKCPWPYPRLGRGRIGGGIRRRRLTGQPIAESLGQIASRHSGREKGAEAYPDILRVAIGFELTENRQGILEGKIVFARG